jgi:hypothetical protein
MWIVSAETMSRNSMMMEWQRTEQVNTKYPLPFYGGGKKNTIVNVQQMINQKQYVNW